MTKENIAVIIIVAALLTGCATPTAGPTATPTPGALAPTATTVPPTEVPTATPTETPSPRQTPTSTPEPTATPTPPPTATPTNTPVPTPTFDLSAAGFPAQPIPYWNQPPPGFLAYDEANYHIYERVMHGRPVRLVIHKQAGIAPDSREEMAEWVFDAWASAWEVFGGFPYESYTFKIPLDQSGYWGAQGIGVEFAVDDMLALKGDWPEYREREWHIDFAHEVFHAWNGKALPPAVYLRAWLLEGCTEYYSYRIAANQKLGYAYGMQRMWKPYRRVRGTPRDMPLAEAHMETIDPDLRVPIIYMKGGLVCYLMDHILVRQGLSIDDLLRALYEDFVTTGARYTPESVQATLEGLSGDDWTEFFDDYVYGTETLPVDGTFVYLQH